ncbi:MAG: NAD(P)/FAD-dependent oxidoreductase [Actinomycetota bacterium]
MNSRVVVVGGGIGGATAALRLARRGKEVVLCEGSQALGGLVPSFSVGGTPIECYYHHVFPHEHDIIDLIRELGLERRLAWYRSTVGVLVSGRVWPFTSPLDLMRFRPLPLAARLHMGIGALRLGRVDDWGPLDRIPARDWLARYTGERAARVVWEPLLRAKFGPAAAQVPAAWMWGRFRQRAGARRDGGERLGYLRGGFCQLFDAIETDLVRLGVEVRTSVRVKDLLTDGGRVCGVGVDGEQIEADAVLYTGDLPGLAPLVPEAYRDPTWSAQEGLGVLCGVLELRRPLTRQYWTNVCDPDVPFGGMIEHTNLVSAGDYGGRHVLYLSRYFSSNEPVASCDPEAEVRGWVEVLADHVPGFSTADILAVHSFRAPYAAPLVTTGYGDRIPALEPPLGGLYVSTTAQIYPADRGMSEAVRMATAAADTLAARGRPTRECA